MIVHIDPAPLRGSIAAIHSKSQAHRLLICAALARGETRVVCPSLSDDILATVSCLEALGAEIEYRRDAFVVMPIEAPKSGAVLDCGESGSTLRFLLPVVCALGIDAEIVMHGRLPERPLSPLWEELCAHGAQLEKSGSTLRVSGGLTAGDYSIDAGVSSQFISGLLFALSILNSNSTLRLTGSTESAGYIEMTLAALRAFGAETPFADSTYHISGGRGLVSPGEAKVEGDWSNAAFWISAGLLSDGLLECTGLDPASPQGDRAIVEAAAAVRSGGAVIDASDIPDLVPVLSALASATKGVTRFVNAGRLRLKESDRIKTTCAMINALGGDAQETPDGLVVSGRPRLRGGEVDSAGDHRIAMSAAVAAIACEGRVTVRGAQCVSKSYPAFWRDYERLGGRIEEED